ncbi:hypothetical protein Tco_1427691 [Tanacetum coccineum]
MQVLIHATYALTEQTLILANKYSSMLLLEELKGEQFQQGQGIPKEIYSLHQSPILDANKTFGEQWWKMILEKEVLKQKNLIEKPKPTHSALLINHTIQPSSKKQSTKSFIKCKELRTVEAMINPGQVKTSSRYNSVTTRGTSEVKVTNVDDDVDDSTENDLALNVDHIFEADECDAFRTLIVDEGGIIWDEYYDVHEMQNDVQTQTTLLTLMLTIVQRLNCEARAMCVLSDLSNQVLAPGMLPLTEVNYSMKQAGSKPRAQYKEKNRILPAKKENKKEVEVRLRTNKSVWTKVNRVGSSISSKRVVINSNSDSVNSASDGMCVVNVLNSVNATPTLRIVLHKGKLTDNSLNKTKQIWQPKSKLSDNSLSKTQRVWKATGKLIYGYGEYVMGDCVILKGYTTWIRTWTQSILDNLKVSRGTNLYTISIDEYDEVLDMLLFQSFQVQICLSAYYEGVGINHQTVVRELLNKMGVVEKERALGSTQDESSINGNNSRPPSIEMIRDNGSWLALNDIRAGNARHNHIGDVNASGTNQDNDPPVISDDGPKQEGIDFEEESLLQLLRIEAIEYSLPLRNLRTMILRCGCQKTAFLNGDLQEDVLLSVNPEGFEIRKILSRLSSKKSSLWAKASS